MPTPEHERWSQDRVARELEAWFATRCFEQWAPYSAFVRDRRKRLHAALMRHGGPQHWAIELGVAFIDRHPGPRRDQTEIRDNFKVVVSRAPSQALSLTALAARARPASQSIVPSTRSACLGHPQTREELAATRGKAGASDPRPGRDDASRWGRWHEQDRRITNPFPDGG